VKPKLNLLEQAWKICSNQFSIKVSDRGNMHVREYFELACLFVLAKGVIFKLL